MRACGARPAAPATQLINALHDLKDYGSASANASSAITIPSAARDDLGIPAQSQWQVMGSPALGVVLLVARHASPRETLDFLLRARPEPGDDRS